MGLNFEIRQLGESDVDPYEDHMERLSRESGDGVTPIFMVLQKGVFKRKPDEIRKLWAAGTHEEQWRRTWGAWSSEKIIGNFYIQGSGDPNAKHRAIVAMGIEAPYRRIN